MSIAKGFTLIELVIVILLLGILAAFAVPKWLGKGGFETHTLRDELVTRLRLVQTMNMQEGAVRCTQLVVDSSGFAHITQVVVSGATCSPPGPIADWNDNQRTRGRMVTPSSGMRISFNNSSDFVLHFDQMGRPTGDCATSNDCTLQVSDGREVSRIKIEAEGYIHALP